MPLSFKITYTNPVTGLVETVTGTTLTGIIIPNFAGITTLPISLQTTDACGRVVTQNETFKYENVYYLNQLDSTCGGKYLQISYLGNPNFGVSSGNYTVSFTSYPAGFNPADYPPNTLTFGSATSPLPEGVYSFIITDKCGRTQNKTVTLTKRSFNPLLQNYVPICTSNKGVLSLTTYGYTISQSRITSAPQEFITQYGPLPYMIPDGNYELSNGQKTNFILDNVPVGSYTLEITESCGGTTLSKTINVTSVTPAATAPPVLELNCSNQFRTTNGNYYYQIYFPTLGKWGTSLANTQTDGSGQQAPMKFIIKNAWENGVVGKYRIVQYPFNYPTINNNVRTNYYCDPKVLQEFEIGAPLTFNNAYAFQCADGTYDVTLSVSGGQLPTKYYIVSSAANDATIIRDNGTNPIFEDLPGGIYFFRVYDNCGNFTTRKMDITLLGKPGIKTVVNCTDSTLKLVVEGLDYLNYQWYKEDNPTNILSTTNTLDLGQYTASDAGIYHVKITSNSTTSCINNTVVLVLSVDALTNASAGTGQNVVVNYDGVSSSINLFNYISGSYDGYGTWTETTPTPSNLLVNNVWHLQNAPAGTYSFKYTVNPLCAGTASTTTVTINLVKVCYKLPALATAGNPALPTHTGITTLTGPGVLNNWLESRKGGWLVIKSNQNGMVINRVSFNAQNLPFGIPAQNFVAGMMVYDITNDCLKIFNGTTWNCYTKQTCPE